MYDIISRERAGLVEPVDRIYLTKSYIKGLTVHYTGAARNPSMNDIDDVFDYLQKMQNKHIKQHGWNDIKYSFAISNVSNEIISLRGFDIMSEHSDKPQMNRTFLSCLWVGGEEDIPNDYAKEALENLVELISLECNKKILVLPFGGKHMNEWIETDSPYWKKPKRKANKWQTYLTKILKKI